MSPNRNDEFIEHVLLPYSAIYERIRRPDSRNEKPEVSGRTNLLSQYNSREWHAAAMWILRNLDENPQRQAELLRDLERVIGLRRSCPYGTQPAGGTNCPDYPRSEGRNSAHPDIRCVR